MSNGKKKIAVLGSGMASLAAVYELTSYSEWKEHYDITIYQMGWRLGGKTATGRGVNQRIQEHGIHIAQGWYENAFRLIQDAYKECEEHQLMPNSPFKSWEDAFVRENTTLLTHFDPKAGKWLKKNIIFPSNNYVPGQGGPLPFSAILEKSIALIKEILFGDNPNTKSILHHAEVPVGITPLEDHSIWDNFHFLHFSPGTAVRHEAEKYLNHIIGLTVQLGNVDSNKHHSIIQELLDTIIHWFHKLINAIVSLNEHLYWVAVFVEFGLINLKGTFKDVYDAKSHSLDYDRINDLDYREWLAKNGASDRLLNSAMVRFLYAGTFHNLTGQNQQGSLAAGVGLHFLTLSIGYKGAFVWKFKAGTADTMITPIYLVLKNRGVSFKFFNKVEQVHHSASGEIEQISMAEQVTLKNNIYNPTYNLNGLEAWPGEPLYEQIEDEQAKELQNRNIDLEMSWSNWVNPRNYILEKGKDFDVVLLGIPIDVLGGSQGICKQIIHNEPKWKAMTEKVKTIPTMSMQLWLSPSLSDLGMELQEWGFPKGSLPNLVTYANPQYSWIDMSQVIPYEGWNGNEPGMIIYFTGSFTDPEVVPEFMEITYPEQQIERVMRISEQWLRDNMGWFFPKATTLEYPNGIDFQIIIDFSKNATTDYGLLKTQYFRANVNPTDRYTLSLPGTNKYRLKADETGFDNMVIAGDWTNFGVNVGYYEGAIISGLKAGQAIRMKLNLKCTTEIYDTVKMR